MASISRAAAFEVNWHHISQLTKQLREGVETKPSEDSLKFGGHGLKPGTIE